MKTIKELRVKRGLNSNEMAKELKIAPGVYSDKERGRRKFQPAEIVQICKMFDVRVEEIKDFYKNDKHNENPKNKSLQNQTLPNQLHYNTKKG